MSTTKKMPPTTGEDSANREPDCVKNWEEDLKNITNQLLEICAKKNQAEFAYANASEWEGKLKMYCDAIEKTEALTIEINNVLIVFSAQLEVICKNTVCLIEATEILYCLVKESFDCMDGLKEKLTAIMREIECQTLPNISSKTSIVLQCLTIICNKVDEAKAYQHDLIKKVIDILKCAQQLNEMICGDCCGIRHFIHKMCHAFGIVHTSTDSGEEPKPADCPEEDEEENFTVCGITICSCDAEILNKPEFPLENSIYFTKTKGQYGKAKTEKGELQVVFNDQRKMCEELTSCKKSLEDAIEASKAAKECK